MSVRTSRLTRSGDRQCRTSSNFTSSDGPPCKAPALTGNRLSQDRRRQERHPHLAQDSGATNYNRREGETWKSDPQWHRVTLFAKLHDRLTNATIGDLVRITGRIGQSKYKVDGHTQYSVDLIADGFAILAKAKPKTVEDDMQD
jgi:single-strand DNA-binding protein